MTSVFSADVAFAETAVGPGLRRDDGMGMMAHRADSTSLQLVR